MGFLIVDLEFGGLDGWYADQETARTMAERWMQDLKHSRVIVVEYEKEEGEDIQIGKAFMADRNARAELRGKLPILDSSLRSRDRQKCIEKATELLRDLYDPKIDREVLLLLGNELQRLINMSVQR